MISNAQTYPVPTVFEDWFTTDGTQNFFYRGKVLTDATGNTYMCGATLNNNGNYDILVSKYSGGLGTAGSLVWSAQYNGNGNGFDAANSLTLDTKGDLYVCGTTYESSADSNNVIVRKYNGTSGTLVWSRQYDFGVNGHDGAVDVVFGDKKIFITGASFNGTNYDVVTISYDTLGNQQWVQRYDYNSLNDGGYKLRVNGKTVVVIGAGQQNLTNIKYLTVRYRTNGTFLNAQTHHGTTNGFSEITDVQVDNANNIYVTGGVVNAGTGYDYMTIKMDSLLNNQWTKTYDANGLNDKAKGMVVDNGGNVYVTGYSGSTAGTDFTTIKYSANGTQLWVQNFNGGGEDTARAIIMDKFKNNLYISGTSFNGSSSDYHTMKYDTTGNQIWEINFNSWQNGNDQVRDMALDSVGGIIVNGQTQGGGILQYNTVRYVEKDVIVPPDTVKLSSSYLYVQNRGQLLNTDTLPVPQIKYYVPNSWPAVYFLDTAISYLFSKIDTSVSTQDTLHRVDMLFISGSNSAYRVRAYDKTPSFTNYFLGHIPDGRTNVPNYKRLLYPDVFPGVDVEFNSNGRGMRHYFIAHPLANPAAILWQYKGATSVFVDGNGTLNIVTSIDTIKQRKAKAFEIDGSGNRTDLGWQPDYYVVGGNIVMFINLGSYNSNNSLGFECDWGNPQFFSASDNLKWCTYYGGSSLDDLQDIKIDKSKNKVACGWTQSVNLPITFGQYQGTNAGQFDALIVKFSKKDSLAYSTYYGGIGDEYNTSLALDSSNNIFITGTTGSPDLPMPLFFPVGAYIVPNRSGPTEDIFVAKFDSLCTILEWATYYGGSTAFERSTNIGVNKVGDIYVVASDIDVNTPFKFKSGAFNDTTKGAGLIIKFNSQFQRKWATRFGTTALGIGAASVDFDASNNVYVTGSVNSANNKFPLTWPGGNAYIDSTCNCVGGTTDGYIVKFNSNDSVVWCTYYGGSNSGIEEGKKIIVDGTHNSLYVLGWTTSTDFPIFHQGGAYIDSIMAGSDKVFILKFDLTTLQRKWATLFGGNGSDNIDDPLLTYNAIKGNGTVDAFGNLYIGSTTTSTNFPTNNPSSLYYKSSNQSISPCIFDAYISSFSPGNTLVWSTYFGGRYHDGVSSLAIVDSTLYVVGPTTTNQGGTNPFPLVNPGSPAYFNSTFGGPVFNCNNATGSTDGFIARFAVTDPVFTGISEQSNNSHNLQLQVYPNPSNDVFTLEFETSEKQKTELGVYDLLGQKIYFENFLSSVGKNKKMIDLKICATGIYFIVIKSSDKIFSKKIIKE